MESTKDHDQGTMAKRHQLTQSEETAKRTYPVRESDLLFCSLSPSLSFSLSLSHRSDAISFCIGGDVFLGDACGEALVKVLLALDSVDELLAALQLAPHHCADVELLQRILQRITTPPNHIMSMRSRLQRHQTIGCN